MKTCFFCKGPLGESRIDYMAQRKKRFVLIRALPVELCGQCGEVYLDAAASRRVDEALAHASSAREHMEVPVVHCAS